MRLPDIVLLYGGADPIAQLYVNQLATIKPEELAKANKKIVVIGCGDYQPVNFYAGGPIFLVFDDICLTIGTGRLD